MTTKLCGKGGKISIGGKEIAIGEWQATSSKNWVKSVSFDDTPFQPGSMKTDKILVNKLDDGNYEFEFQMSWHSTTKYYLFPLGKQSYVVH